ncbi:MAG: endonuclease [Arhodomonas sp.]|nr:endonuclease [Arhodomonas sp.]
MLTQNTAWRNVERAMAALRDAGMLDPDAIVAAPDEELAAAIRPSGYFRVKARRLKAVCTGWREAGGAAGLSRLSTPALREYLLDLHGVGRETADDIVLYGFHRPVFVVDAYTDRILGRYGWLTHRPGYEGLRRRLESALPAPAAAYQRHHAQIVALGKDHCRAEPRCSACPVGDICARHGVDGDPKARSRTQ